MNRLQRISGHLSAQPVSASYSCIKVDTDVTARVGVVTLNRPKALNALNDQLIRELSVALKTFEKEQKVGCIVITGGGRAFAAGADIKEMKDMNYYQMSTHDKIEPWECVSSCRVPLIAAVNGYALGGGCEIAMMCDMILASTKAVFGQPEINIGTIPGAGGTQRLTRAIGKSKAMKMILSGRNMKAHEAEKAGLAASVHEPEELMPAALKLAAEIASKSLPVAKLCKESVNAAYEASLTTGVRIERRLFHSTFGLADRKEGMTAFASKRKPQWKHE